MDFSNVPLWLCIPFAGLLLCIAIFPLVKEAWWEKNRPWVVAFWSIALLIAFAVVYSPHAAMETALESIVNDYLTFIVLLFGLFCVSGNINLEGNYVGAPRTNTGLLLIGTLLASCIGTTGASMLLVRPIIMMNSWRKHKTHIMVFFIFMASNMGGCLTPIGDPPLLMGFMRGVPFFWSLHLFPVLAFNVVIMLTLFYFLDRKAYYRDIADGHRPELTGSSAMVKVNGAHNIVFLIGIIIAVILSGTLPSLPEFQTADGTVAGIPVFGEVKLGYPSLIEIAIILLAAFLSFKTTKSEIRVKNHFTWGAIEEVAILFIGIFITMQPALFILKTKGPELGVTQPFQMFWLTGILSSFLDNTPTYLVFLTTAGTLGFAKGLVTSVGVISAKMLIAISCGAVFMGANTYIGNAPNFMVKSISDENGISMPSFFGYIGWSLRFLVPVFILDTIVFFIL